MASTLNSTTTSASPNHTSTTSTNSHEQQLQQMLCRAAFLNGLGVAVLMQNEHQPHLDNNPVHNTACLQSFQQALALMGQAAASCCRTRGGGGGGGAPVVWKSFCLPKLKDDRFFVCAQALVFNVPTNKPVITQADISFYCAIVLHNMALTHHRLAILGTTAAGGCGIQRDDQQGHESNIQQAEQLYEHTYRVLTTIVNSHSPGDDIDMLKAVTLNNLAQIYYMTYRFKESDDLLWEIRKLCPALWRSSSMGANNIINDGASSASSSSPMFHQIIQEIVINVFFVAGHPSVAPSA